MPIANIRISIVEQQKCARVLVHLACLWFTGGADGKGLALATWESTLYNRSVCCFNPSLGSSTMSFSAFGPCVPSLPT